MNSNRKSVAQEYREVGRRGAEAKVIGLVLCAIVTGAVLAMLAGHSGTTLLAFLHMG